MEGVFTYSPYTLPYSSFDKSKFLIHFVEHCRNLWGPLKSVKQDFLKSQVKDKWQDVDKIDANQNIRIQTYFDGEILISAAIACLLVSLYLWTEMITSASRWDTTRWLISCPWKPRNYNHQCHNWGALEAWYQHFLRKKLLCCNWWHPGYFLADISPRVGSLAILK